MALRCIVSFAVAASPASGDVSAALEAFLALSPTEQQDFQRQILQREPAQPGAAPTAVCAGLCAPACEGAAAVGEAAVDACMGRCNRRCSKHRAAGQVERPGALSPWITFNGAVQHVGLSTSNLTRSVLFYTQVMGGVEVMGAGGDGWDGDDVYQLLMGAALMRGGAAADWAADLSSGGKETMSARYISFDSVQVELLDYHTKEAELQRLMKMHNASTFPRTPEAVAASLSRSFPTFSDSNVPPSVAGNMHVSFNVRPEVDLNQFVTALETTSRSLGFDEVFCNRLVPLSQGANGKPDTTEVPEANNSYEVTDGDFDGWSLAYCKGPDGEQLEFNKVERKAKEHFDQAFQTYFSGGENPIWV